MVASTDLELVAALQSFASGDMAQAEAACRSVLSAAPEHVDAHLLLGAVLLRTRQLDKALASLDSALRVFPTNGQLTELRTHTNRELCQVRVRTGHELLDGGSAEKASECFREALAFDPDCFDAAHLLGIVAAREGRLKQALDWFDRTLLVDPGNSQAHNNRANVLKEMRRHDEALSGYGHALAIDPESAETHNNCGAALYELGRFDEALASHEHAIELSPDVAEAHLGRGNALRQLNRVDDALAAFGQAIALKPDGAKAYYNRGNLLRQMHRFHHALADYDRAIAAEPGNAHAHNNRGNVLKDLGRLDAALASYDQAIALMPGLAVAQFNRAAAFSERKDHGAALECCRKALALEPGLPYLPGELMHTRMKLCDWGGYAKDVAALTARIRNREPATTPFPVLAVTADASIQRLAAEVYVSDRHPAHREPARLAGRPREGKLRIGYFSADFFAHATAYLMASLFETHDREHFEIVGFSLSTRRDDAMRKRLERAFDRFIDLEQMSDDGIADLSQEAGIDIAVDLKGFTRGSRLGIFSRRAAPIQVGYLGYPGTTGASYIDYIVADKVLIPEASRQHYAEKIIYLADSYQVNDRQRSISDRVFSRPQLGLPEHGLVFCCFNSSYKITPDVFDGWMRILTRVEGSVLWLLDSNHVARENLRKEAARRGIDPARLVFAKRLPLAEHLARHRAADLFIDTYPCNAHTTASDALWAGLPVLTRMGESFASRVAASLLTAVGLPELITTNQEAYEAKAIELATHPDQLRSIRNRLAANQLTTALFDTERFARNLESAYVRIHERHLAGLPPDHISRN
jgi:predicted O-linked N-acetylglucosamine transferase (SPINDLY family)